MAGKDRSSARRERLAYEAARILAEQGGADFERARRKAAERTGTSDRRDWPSNEAIRDALLAQRRIFLGDAHAREQEKLRAQALAAMRTFSAFTPRLVGPVLAGIGRTDQGVQIHLFAERPEDVLLALMERKIPWEERERNLRYSTGERRPHPAIRFVAGGIPFELVVLPPRALRNPPLDPVNERPERGAGIAELERLIAQDASGEHSPHTR